MAFPSEMTLDEAVSEVQTRIGYASKGTSNVRNRSLIESFIRRAVKQLSVPPMNWGNQLFEMQIPLVEGQPNYDYPDEVGRVEAVWVVDDRGVTYPLEPGIPWHEVDPDPGDDSEFQYVTGVPVRIKLLNNELRLSPAPSETFVTLNIRYKLRIPALVDPTERLPFDSEAVIQSAAIIAKTHYGMPGASDDRGDLARYLEGLKRSQRLARTFFVGGRKSHFVTRPKENSLRSRRNIGSHAPWSETWNPW